MSVTAARGFVAGGTACGIKESGAFDLAIVATAGAEPVAAAGVFTTNLVRAAPVEVSRRHLDDFRAAAVVINSGNANAATGPAGRRDALRMCELTGAALGVEPTDVLVCSTGLIGVPLPMDALEEGIPRLARSLAPGEAAGAAAGDAMLTTDTVRKQARAVANLQGGVATVGGVAKGAAMLAPSMATMLAVITTDAAVEPEALYTALGVAVADTFDNLVVDGCRSTNDTVLVLANGRCGNDAVRTDSLVGLHAFTDALTEVCASLTEQMAADAEGATKLARVRVVGARSADDARYAARAVAGSQLVQCSLYGCDAYWGRVLSELGASGAYLDPETVDISYNGITVCRGGTGCAHDEAALARQMRGRDITIVCDLHQGTARAEVIFTDLTHAYIDENMGTS